MSKTPKSPHDKDTPSNKWEEIDLDAQEEETPEEVRALEHPSYEELEQKLTKAEQLAEENWNKMLRTQAEFENVKRRAERDVTSAHKYGNEKLLNELIPVIDSLEHGMEMQPGEKASKVHEGMELTLKMFQKVLEKFGIKIINPTGEPFNPAYHEAMTMQPSSEVEPNRVLQVLQKGYVLNDRLIRPARVIVSKAG